MRSFWQLTSIGLAVSLGSMLSGCTDLNLQVGNYRCGEFIPDAYRGKPAHELLAAFRSSPVDKQYAIYICGAQVNHPPLYTYLEPFAAQGKSILPFLQARLVETNDALTVVNLIQVYDVMNWGGSYVVDEDKALMQALDAKVVSVKDQPYGPLAQQVFARITPEKRKARVPPAADCAK
jgi:hypothetical protein